MKKNQVIAFTCALALAAGAAAAGETAANVGSIKAEGNGHSSEEGLLYEDAIDTLYENSTSISDEEILEIARSMRPDLREVERVMGEKEAASIADTLAQYEAEKCEYILADNELAPEEDNLHYEWDRQEAYTRLGLGQGQESVSLLPGIAVTSCTAEDGVVTASVDEWITQVYTDEADLSVENVSAYRYYYTCTLQQDAEGIWQVVSVSGTDRNFIWTEDAAVQEAMAGMADETEETGAQSAQNSLYGTASLDLYGAGTYTYNPDAAVAYADKWATSRNPEYRQYPGVDCCNFVSQCLYAGGMPVNDKWYPASYAWINCSGAIANFKQFGTFMKANDGNVAKGNPVYYDWNSNGVYDHTAICVGRNNSGTPIIDAHTGDHYHATWQLGSNGTRATIQLRGNGFNTAAGTSRLGTWQKDGGVWYYVTDNGTKVTGWLQYSNDWYYLAADGKMTTGWQKIGNAWYYLGQDGKMFKNGWLRSGGRYYYISGTGAMQTGWVLYKDKYYYLAANGAMQTGWVLDKGKYYYLAADGAMQTGLVTVSGKIYCLGRDGAMVTGWQTINGKKYFFSPSAGGAAATTSWSINGKIYYFNSDGVLKE